MTNDTNDLTYAEALQAAQPRIAEARASLTALSDQADEFYGTTVDDVKLGGWAFATEDVTPLVEQARTLLGMGEDE